jgi:RNA polymerase sigma factor (sigma-70 family)
MVGQLEAELAQAARDGDQRALDSLIAQHLPLVYNIVGRALAQRADVDDVVQDTMLRVVRGLHGLRDPQRFRSWLVAVTMNEVRDYRRARQDTPAALEEFADLADPGADFVDLTLTQLRLSDQRREVALATSWLDDDDRELLSLWWLEAGGHLSRADLVESLELNAHHVTVRIARMKGQLEAARLVVRALTTFPRCRELDDAVASWRGRPTPLWRKRFARHIRECEYCPTETSELIPAERLLAGLALVPLPAGYLAYVLSGVYDAGLPAALPPQTQAPGSSNGNGGGGGGGGSHGRRGGNRSSNHSDKNLGRGHRRRTGRRWTGRLAGKPLLAVAAITVVAGISAVAMYTITPGTHDTASQGPGSEPGASLGLTGAPQVSPSGAPSATAPGSASASAKATAAKPSASAAKSSAHATATGTGSGGSTQQAAVQQVLLLINRARADAGLPAYTITSGLTTSATKHTQTMAGGCGLSHQCSGEPSLGSRETAAGVYWTSAGENIGDGGPVADTTTAATQMAVGLTQGMLDEKPPNDGHRQNILSSSFHHIGISVYRDSSGTVWMTQDFSS